MQKDAEYLCGHNVLKAHARAYHIYNNEFRKQQQGKIGIVLHCRHHYSKYKNDSVSAEIAFPVSVWEIRKSNFFKKWRLSSNNKAKNCREQQIRRIGEVEITRIFKRMDKLYQVK